METIKGYTCPSTCPFGGKCLKTISWFAVLEEMNLFWGDYKDEALSTKQRRDTIQNKMLQSIVFDSNNNHQFKFQVGADLNKYCEAFYMNIIGHPVTNMWKNCKSSVITTMTTNGGSRCSLEQQEQIRQVLNETKYISEKGSATKTRHATHFIQFLAEFQSSYSPNDGEEELRILPFETISQLFAEYNIYCKYRNEPLTETAREETFRKAWRTCHSNGTVRFTRGKGTFPTCDICNNANDMLSQHKMFSYTQRQREIIFSFKVNFKFFRHSYNAYCI
jgi:hypothetical protein